MDDSTTTQKITAIIREEQTLELIIHKLLEKTVARHDISVQASPDEIAAHYGSTEMRPDMMQNSESMPKKEAYLQDDFGWSLGFSFSIPLFIGLVVGIFIIGDVRSLHDNIFWGIIGAVIGGTVGFIIMTIIKTIKARKIKHQENHGGLVLWVTVHSQQQKLAALQVLKDYNAQNVRLSE